MTVKVLAIVNFPQNGEYTPDFRVLIDPGHVPDQGTIYKS
jgi:hypothetical protein